MGDPPWRGRASPRCLEGDICFDQNICSSVSASLQIGLLATLAGTILGTLIAFSLVRYRFRGRSATNLLIFLPMATPEVVMGSALLALFLNASGIFTFGFGTVVIAHIMFTISLSWCTVKARLSVLDPRLEQAAMDPYADERQAFRYITLPLVAPGMRCRCVVVVRVCPSTTSSSRTSTRAATGRSRFTCGLRGPWCAATGQRHRLHLVLRNAADRFSRSGHSQRAS